MRAARATHQIKDQQSLRKVRDADPDFAGTLAKGLMILQCFVRDPRAHANSEFSERLGIPRPTVSRLCRTLQALGYLDHDDRLDRYFIGPAAVALGYPYVIQTPLLAQLRPAMQQMAERFEGAVSVGVTMDLDVVYVETSAHEHGTLKRPGVGAVRGIVETAMGRAWLAQQTAVERNAFLGRARRERPDEYSRSTEGLKDSLAHYPKRGFAINMGDAGLGVLAVGGRRISATGPGVCYSTAPCRATGPGPATCSRPLGPRWWNWCGWRIGRWGCGRARRARRRPCRSRWTPAQARAEALRAGVLQLPPATGRRPQAP